MRECMGGRGAERRKGGAEAEKEAEREGGEGAVLGGALSRTLTPGRSPA